MNLKFFFLKIMKGKNSQIFFLKKVGGALIRGGALNRDYTVILITLINAVNSGITEEAKS